MLLAETLGASSSTRVGHPLARNGWLGRNREAWFRGYEGLRWPSRGAYAGMSYLGLEWKASVINPLNIALPVPQLRGVPCLHSQYRTSIGLSLRAG